MTPLEHRERIKQNILSCYSNHSDIVKSEHLQHKYIRKEGDKYIYEEPKNNLHHINNDISSQDTTKEEGMITTLQGILNEKQPKKVKDTIQKMINYLVAPEIPEREFSKLFDGIRQFVPRRTPTTSFGISAHTGEKFEIGDNGAKVVMPSFDVRKEYIDAFGMKAYFHSSTAKVITDMHETISKLEAFKHKYNGKIDTSFIDENIADIKKALPIAEAMNVLHGKIVSTKELNKRAKKEAMPYDDKVISDAVNANPQISAKLDEVEQWYIEYAQRNTTDDLATITKDAGWYRQAVIGNLIHAVGKLTNGEKLTHFAVKDMFNGKGGLEGIVEVNDKRKKLFAIYAEGSIQRLHIRFLIK